jgi:hypothetical protein
LNLSPKNHNPIQTSSLQENEKVELPKNCQNPSENLPFDPDLAYLNRVWPGLNDDTRRQVMELIGGKGVKP